MKASTVRYNLPRMDIEAEKRKVAALLEKLSREKAARNEAERLERLREAAQRTPEEVPAEQVREGRTFLAGERLRDRETCVVCGREKKAEFDLDGGKITTEEGVVLGTARICTKHLTAGVERRLCMVDGIVGMLPRELWGKLWVGK